MGYADLKKVEKGIRRFFHDDITVVVIFLDHESIGEKKASAPELSIRSFADTTSPSGFNFLQMDWCKCKVHSLKKPSSQFKSHGELPWKNLFFLQKDWSFLFSKPVKVVWFILLFLDRCLWICRNKVGSLSSTRVCFFVDVISQAFAILSGTKSSIT